MLDYIDYTKENGKNIGHDIVVYALSTCAFCKKGLNFLREHNVAFTYVYVDQLPYDTKQRIKEDLKAKFDKRVVFPYLVYDDAEVIVGFVPDEWKSVLEL